MAEVAIPMAVLGVMYIISNKDKEQEKKEAFTNSLPNTRRPVKNYPVDKHRDLLNETNVQTYQGYRNKNENYYQPEGYKKALELNEKKVGQFQSLTGETINSKSMEHNNMVPFFGSKVTQGTGEKGYEGLLDLYTGSGSQQNKKEGKGIFTWANGDSYCGQWENDEYHGKGILKKDGIIKDGYWDKGDFIEN